MRIEVAGANITTSVAEIIDTLQNDGITLKGYTAAIDRVICHLILTSDEVEDDALETLNTVRQLAMLRQDLCSLAAPSDADDPENDTPLLSV